MYQLPINSLVSGFLLDLKAAESLSIQDCLFLGKHAYNLRLKFEAAAWVQQALNLAKEKGEEILEDQAKKLLNIIRQKTTEVSETSAIMRNMSALCRGEAIGVIPSHLRCHHLSQSDPWLRLGPINSEWLYVEPDIRLLHSFVSKAEALHLRMAASGKVGRML